MGATCQQVRRLVPRIWQELCLRLSVSTLRRALRQAGYSWKRMRRSLKAQRDPDAFLAAQQQLAALRQAEQRGELAVYYADEVRFSRQAPVPLCLAAARPASGGSAGRTGDRRRLFGAGLLATGRPASDRPLAFYGHHLALGHPRRPLRAGRSRLASPPEPAHRPSAR